MKTHVFIACSLDGYIARTDGNLDWLLDVPNETNSDYGFAEFISQIDAILMGRMTFEAIRGFGSWPYNKPVFVLSRTMQQIPEKYAGKIEIVNGSITGVLAELGAGNIRHLYVDGGKTIQSFLKEDLIDEMIVTTVSRLIGKGIPLFGDPGRDLDFELVKSETLNKYLVKQHYIRIRNPSFKE